MESAKKLGERADAHKDGIWGLAPIPEMSSQLLGDFVTGGSDGRLRSWRLRQPDQLVEDEEDALMSNIRTFSRHCLPVISVSVAAEASVAVSTSLDGAVKVWDIGASDAEPKSTQPATVSDTWDIAVTSDGRFAVTGGSNGLVQIIDCQLTKLSQSYHVGAGAAPGETGSNRRESPMIMSVGLRADDSRVALGGQDGAVMEMDVETGKITSPSKMARHGGPVRSVQYMPSEAGSIVSASDDTIVNLYDCESGDVTSTLKGHGSMVFSATGNMDGRYIASGGADRSVKIWDRAMREAVFSCAASDSVWGVSYVGSGSTIVFVGDSGDIGVIDCGSGEGIA